MKDQPQHLYKEAEHAAIHDPTAEETLLAQWLRKALEKGPVFWAMVLGAIGILAAALALFNSVSSTRSVEAEAWYELMLPTEIPESKLQQFEGFPEPVRALLAVSDGHPGTQAALWAKYRAASFLYQEALRNLPNNRDAARPDLRQSSELYGEVADAADVSNPVRRYALMGVARSLETRGDVDLAREAYEKVAKEYPDTPTGTEARERAELMAKKDVKDFYEEFYTRDFSTVREGAGSPLGVGNPTLPPALDFGKPSFTLPDVTPGATGTVPATTPELPSLPEAPAEGQPASPATGADEGKLPRDVFAPSVTPKG